jgi:hypothetical protein
MLSLFANAQGKLREASRRLPRETLRCAQGDKRGGWRRGLSAAKGDKGLSLATTCKHCSAAQPIE